MLGKIIKLSQEKQAALISGDDNKPYVFRFKDWCADCEITIGLRVEFDVFNEKQAHNVFLAEEVKLPEIAKLVGTIVKISHEKQLALILSDDKRQYVFALKDWCEQFTPDINMRVQFVPLNEKQAHQVQLKDEFGLLEQQEQTQQKQQERFTQSEKTAFRQPENTQSSKIKMRQKQSNHILDKEGNQLVLLQQPSIMRYIKDNLKWKGFAGRASVKEFWSFSLLMIVFAIFTIVSMAMLGNFLEASMYRGRAPRFIYTWGFETIMLMWLAVCAFIGFYPTLVSIALTVRRLHDFNVSGWTWLVTSIVCAIPIVNILVFIVIIIMSFMIHFINAKTVENKYGYSTVYGYADEEGVE